jgi:hypothetical protein
MGTVSIMGTPWERRILLSVGEKRIIYNLLQLCNQVKKNKGLEREIARTDTAAGKTKVNGKFKSRKGLRKCRQSEKIFNDRKHLERKISLNDFEKCVVLECI